MSEKIIIFDASTLITIAMNGLLEELRMLKKIFKGKFIIPNEVKYDAIDRPMKIKRFELEAMKLQNLLEEKVIELPASLSIDSAKISKETEILMSIANTTFEGNGKSIHLIDLGETACLVLSKILTEKKMPNVLAVDERTTRMLCEKPENLKQLFQKKLKVRIKSNQENYPHFEGFRFIRSSEIVYIAYKKKIIRWKNKDILDALLYGVKFKGCAISEDEIKEIKKLA